MTLARLDLAAAALLVIAGYGTAHAAAASRSPGQESPAEPPGPAQRPSAPAASARTPAASAQAHAVDLSREQALIDDANEALKASDHATARAKAAEATSALLLRPTSERSEAWLELLDSAGRAAWSAQDPLTARAAWEPVLEIYSRTLPHDHPDLQVARLNLASTFRALGELAAARALEEQVLDVRSRTLPPDDFDLQRARSNLADTLYKQRDFAAARALFEQVLAVFSRTLPPDHPDLQSSRANLASALSAQNELHAARALEEQVLEVRSRTLPPDHADLQRARLNLARTLHALGEVRAARALEEQVLEVRSRTLPPDHPDLQRARMNLAITLHTERDVAAARVLFEQVLEVFSRTLPPDHPHLQAARMNLANTLRDQGDFSAARALEEQVLDVDSRTLPPDHPHLQQARASLASTLRAQGDLPAARALLEQVVEIFSHTLPPDHPDLQGARMDLASTLYEQREISAARAMYERVVEVLSSTLPPDHPDLQSAQMNLANALRVQGDLAAARALLEQVLEVYSGLAPDHPGLQRARENLATTLREQGDLSAARAIYEQVLEVFSRTLPPDHPDLQTARANVAITLALCAAEREAKEENEEGRDGVRERCVELVTLLARSATQVARASTLSSSSREAEEHCSSLHVEWHLSTALSFAAGYGVFDPDPELACDAFVLSETTRATALVAARVAHLARSDERYPSLQQEIRAASEELARLVQSGGASAAYDQVIQRRDRAQRDLVRLTSASKEAEGLLAEPDPAALAARLSEHDAIVAYRRYLRGAIPQGETEARSTESLCAFVLRRGKELRLVELGAIEPIERAVANWRDGLGVASGRGLASAAGSDQTPAGARDAEGIRALIFDPLRSALGEATTLRLVLDDMLHAVPIDALPIPASGTTGDLEVSEASADGILLGDRYRIELHSTMQEILSSAAPASSTDVVLTVGGVDYSGVPATRSAGSTHDLAAASPVENGTLRSVPSMLRGGAWEEGFTPLPHTLEEGRGVAELAAREGVGETVMLEGGEASRGSIAQVAPKARFLHLATHGWFAPESVESWSDTEPDDGDHGDSKGDARLSAEQRVKGSSPMVLCGLALAGANLRADALGRYPGLVTAEEISSWDLSHCELAVLSACDTNVGERRAGQGVASLQKALHMAGARTVITSLWKVPDEATKQLMLDFYRRIWVEKKRKSEALWEAKKKLREAKDERGEPLYTTRDWAAWVLTGEPR